LHAVQTAGQFQTASIVSIGIPAFKRMCEAKPVQVKIGRLKFRRYFEEICKYTSKTLWQKFATVWLFWALFGTY